MIKRNIDREIFDFAVYVWIFYMKFCLSDELAIGIHVQAVSNAEG